MTGTVAPLSVAALVQRCAMTSSLGYALFGAPLLSLFAPAVAVVSVATAGVVAAVTMTENADNAGLPGGSGRFVVGRHHFGGRVDYFCRETYDEARLVFDVNETSRRILFELTPGEEHHHEHRGVREWREHNHEGWNFWADNEIADVIQNYVNTA